MIIKFQLINILNFLNISGGYNKDIDILYKQCLVNEGMAL